MVRRLIALVVPFGVALMTGCSVTVNGPVETRVRAQNDLTDLSVDVNGSTTAVDAIDLLDVVVGDVSFALVAGGTTTSSKLTNRSGNVTVVLGEAEVLTSVLGQPVTLSFTDIDPMTTTITTGTTNTVVFDETTAGVIFSALAKKKAI